MLPNIVTFIPNSPTAWSSSSIASPGVNIGITAAGVILREYGAKYSAAKVL